MTHLVCSGVESMRSGFGRSGRTSSMQVVSILAVLVMVASAVPIALSMFTIMMETQRSGHISTTIPKMSM